MNAIPIGLSTLAAAQRTIDIIGQNVANSATPGYHRQTVDLVDRVYDGVNGVGVAIGAVVRNVDDFIHGSILAAGTHESLAGSRLDIEQQVETLFTTAGIDTRLSDFFDQVNRLTVNPADITQRRTVIASAGNLAQALNQVANGLAQLRAGVGQSITQTVDQINKDTAQIADLNRQIEQVELRGGQPNDLLDKRDALIDDLSKLIDVRVVQQDHGVVTVVAAGSPVVIGTVAEPLSVATDPSGNYFVYAGSPTQPPLTVSGGKLAAQIAEYNQALPDYLTRLNDLAAGLIRSVDDIQATGIGLDGPKTSLIGTRGVNNTAAPLDSAGLALPPQAGQLYIGVTDTTSGQRTLTSINIDPTTQSLQDVANAITAATGGQVTATVNGVNGTLQLQAAAGFAFDFAGRLPSTPDSVAMNGTSVPQVTGTWTGPANDTYSFQVVGNGTVGVTPGLTLEVRDGASNLVATLNIGQGYTPGTAIPIGHGVSVSLAAGTTNAGSFSARLISQPDTASILPALGLDTFFTGSDAFTIGVNQDLVNDPTLLSASRSGQPGDALNLERMAALQAQPLLDGNTRTFLQHLLDATGLVGQTVQTLKLQQQAAQTLGNNLKQQEQSVSGVDVNQEMVRLLEFQRMMEAGSKYLVVANNALDSILEIIK